MNIITTGNILLIGALLLFVAVIAGKAAYRFGAPALLFFLGVGILFGFHFISFHSVEATQFIGMIALCIILFTGGMDTKFSEIRPVIAPGVVLATAGVAMTAAIVAGFVTLIAPWIGFRISFSGALLLAATMSSTDSASVFSILRSKKQGLRENLRPLLELESGSNDPMAYVLTILLVGVLSGGATEAMSIPMSVLKFVVQMVLGGAMGYAIGRVGVWTINRINLSNYSLYPVLLLAFVFFIFSFTDLIGGNGYLAVYLAGLVLGNNKLVQKRPLTIFFDGFTWLVQIVMFLTLGLLVNLDELLDPQVLLLGGLVGAFMMFVARPLTVFVCMAPFRKFTAKARVYVSWVGLRGAVPIIFATYPLLAGTEDATLLFNVVFLVTILSLLIQGTTVSWAANLLGLGYEERERAFGVDVHDDIPSVFTEVEVNEAMLSSGNTLREISLPEHTLVTMVCRDGDYFVPQGNTELRVRDKLLVVSDRGEELENTYKDMGIDEVMKL
ncbi:MAG: potassium/proton antiporter [Alistipes sp.]|nr:potassium/proton antiporter [Alistipes sp.]